MLCRSVVYFRTFRFVSFRFVSLRFVLCRFVSFRFIPYSIVRVVSFRFVSFRLDSLSDISVRFVSFLFVFFRFVSEMCGPSLRRTVWREVVYFCDDAWEQGTSNDGKLRWMGGVMGRSYHGTGLTSHSPRMSRMSFQADACRRVLFVTRIPAYALPL